MAVTLRTSCSGVIGGAPVNPENCNRQKVFTPQEIPELSTSEAPGWGLSGSADLASEASDEADRSGQYPEQNKTTNP